MRSSRSGCDAEQQKWQRWGTTHCHTVNSPSTSHTSQRQVVRFSDLANDDNYVLSLADVPGMDDKLTDKLVTLAHHRGKHMLAADMKPPSLEKMAAPEVFRGTIHLVAPKISNVAQVPRAVKAAQVLLSDWVSKQTPWKG